MINYPSIILFTKYTGLLLVLLAVSSCNSYYCDRQIKQDITSKAKNDVNFAGLKFTVKKGEVRLFGNCPTERCLIEVNTTLKSIHVIRKITNEAGIAPVTINASYTKKLQVDSVLSGYPAVWAEVSDTAVVLRGSIAEEETPKLLRTIGMLHAGNTINELKTDNQ
jgi:hypothetical protein